MATLKITTSREIGPDEVGDSVGNIWRSTSPWVGLIDQIDDTHWEIRFDGEDDEEGTFASKAKLSAKQFVKAFEKARAESYQVKGEGKGHGGLCCLETMEHDELGLGCAQDHDTVLQYALLGSLVFG
jgi:hypothetical protein